MKKINITATSKYARPIVRRIRGSKYDYFLDAYGELEEGQGVVEKLEAETTESGEVLVKDDITHDAKYAAKSLDIISKLASILPSSPNSRYSLY